MVETYKRKRSKSTGKTRSRSGSATKPIVRHRETISNPMDSEDKKSDTEFVRIEKRVTRQSRLLYNLNAEHVDLDSEKDVTPISEPVKHNDKKSEKRKSSKRSFIEILCNINLHLTIVLLIPLVMVLNKMCENGGKFRYVQLTEIKLEYFYNYQYIGFVALFLLILGVLAHIPIGTTITSISKDGSPVKYRCNGILSLIICIMAVICLIWTNYLSPKMVYDNYYLLIGSSITVTFVLSYFLLLRTYFMNKLKISSRQGNILERFMMGWEINPRLFGLDLKLFYDSRPGYIGWALLNVVFCFKDLEDNGYKSINHSLLFSALGQIVYCVDALFFEGDIMSKPFLINGRFGFFHCFGNEVIVPFVFTLTTRAIQINKFELPLQYLIGISLVNILGYIIYRTSNIQKNSFRRNPYSVHLCHLKTLTNRKGRQLLVGGWWGLLRHPNYLGDIIMSLSWSSYGGLHFSVCWVYPAYFLLFIITRSIQDDRKCSREHGATWNEYRKCVRYRLIPFVF